MRTRSVVCCLLLAACCGSAAAKKPSGDYDKLVERVKSGDKTVDFRELRLAFANSPGFDRGPDTDPQKKVMGAALFSKDFATAIKNADMVLASDYVDIDAHMAEFMAYRELQEADLAEFHKFVFEGLLKSIADSGDGKTPETAFQVIQVHEEYILLHSLGVGLPESQSLLRKNGHSYDEIKYQDPDSKKDVTIYFNVDIPIKHGL
jgi:hypothetical protein